MNRITRWFSTLPPERQFDIQVKLSIAMVALIIIMLVFAWWLSGEATRRVYEVNSLYANMSACQSLCTGFGR